jgi:hypothetical protein
MPTDMTMLQTKFVTMLAGVVQNLKRTTCNR